MRMCILHSSMDTLSTQVAQPETQIRDGTQALFWAVCNFVAIHAAYGTQPFRGEVLGKGKVRGAWAGQGAVGKVCGNPQHSRFLISFFIAKGKGILGTWSQAGLEKEDVKNRTMEMETHRSPREDVVKEGRKGREGGEKGREGRREREMGGQTQGD